MQTNTLEPNRRTSRRTMRRRKQLLGLLALAVGCAGITKQLLANEPFGTILGQFWSVPARSNGQASYYGGPPNYVGGVYVGQAWQCVEFVRRFYLSVFNLNLGQYNAWVNDASTWFDNAWRMGFSAIPNGSTDAPLVGDIVVFAPSATSPNGHVAILAGIAADRVYTTQQNVSNTSADLHQTLSLRVEGAPLRWTLSGATGTVRGWLRRPFSGTFSVANWHPEGTLLMDGHGTVFVIESGTLRGIPSIRSFATHGFRWDRVVRATAQELRCYARGANLPDVASRRIVQPPNGPVYLITDQGYKRAFRSAAAFLGLGYSWADVSPISWSDLARYPDDPWTPVLTSPLPDGVLLKRASDATVYVVTQGRKRAITSATTARSLGFDRLPVVAVADDIFYLIENHPAAPIDDATIWPWACYLR